MPLSSQEENFYSLIFTHVKQRAFSGKPVDIQQAVNRAIFITFGVDPGPIPSPRRNHLDNAGLFLKALTDKIPAGNNQRHSLTIDPEGRLTVTLALGCIFLPCALEEIDSLKSIDMLVDEIVELARKEVKNSSVNK